MFHYRRLQDADIPYINALQRRRGFEEIEEGQLPAEWIVYGAFSGEEIIGICILFLYRRLPHSDYPGGLIAELGGCYTVPEYRGKGVMSALVGTCLEHLPGDCPEAGAIVSDASSHVISILMNQYGFEDAVEGERRVWKQFR